MAFVTLSRFALSFDHAAVSVTTSAPMTLVSRARERQDGEDASLRSSPISLKVLWFGDDDRLAFSRTVANFEYLQETETRQFSLLTANYLLRRRLPSRFASCWHAFLDGLLSAVCSFSRNDHLTHWKAYGCLGSLRHVRSDCRQRHHYLRSRAQACTPSPLARLRSSLARLRSPLAQLRSPLARLRSPLARLRSPRYPSMTPQATLRARHHHPPGSRPTFRFRPYLRLLTRHRPVARHLPYPHSRSPQLSILRRMTSKTRSGSTVANAWTAVSPLTARHRVPSPKRTACPAFRSACSPVSDSDSEFDADCVRAGNDGSSLLTGEPRSMSRRAFGGGDRWRLRSRVGFVLERQWYVIDAERVSRGSLFRHRVAGRGARAHWKPACHFSEVGGLDLSCAGVGRIALRDVWLQEWRAGRGAIAPVHRALYRNGVAVEGCRVTRIRNLRVLYSAQR
ncbi:hypothetical protein BC938DRAFT_471990 [Jimgerdemannia flammicorona]|uniref:Uncharacterized protein n=1 Tax=Jimgerdemannia flammicorona TaxID=994334 RepID=A0A433Q724_9FUNG|nr:hypothetical protein BC938DRAFT_471990 [Jimgerdemannia flammicorona]